MVTRMVNGVLTGGIEKNVPLPYTPEIPEPMFLTDPTIGNYFSSALDGMSGIRPLNWSQVGNSDPFSGGFDPLGNGSKQSKSIFTDPFTHTATTKKPGIAPPPVSRENGDPTLERGTPFDDAMQIRTELPGSMGGGDMLKWILLAAAAGGVLYYFSKSRGKTGGKKVAAKKPGRKKAAPKKTA